MMIKNTLVVIAMLTSLVACSQNTETNNDQNTIAYGAGDDAQEIVLKYVCEVPGEDGDKGTDEEKGDEDIADQSDDDASQNDSYDPDCVNQQIIISLDEDDVVTGVEYITEDEYSDRILL